MKQKYSLECEENISLVLYFIRSYYIAKMKSKHHMIFYGMLINLQKHDHQHHHRHRHFFTLLNKSF
jgi:hypothetical protein